MPIRVLVVDDSSFFRKHICEILDSDSRLKVVATATNGVEAIEKVAQVKPDVVTMDIEMPIMDGITAVRRIMDDNPVPVLMFSSLTEQGAQSALDALDAGAVDYLPKRMRDLAKSTEEGRKVFCSRVHLIGMRGLRSKSVALREAPKKPAVKNIEAPKQKQLEQAQYINAKKGSGRYKLVVIGTSTGGPVALQHILVTLEENFPLPVLIVQHMPASFTPAFAQRLNRICKLTVKEAEDGEIITPGTVMLAPGGRQLMLEVSGTDMLARIMDGEPNQTYKPSVDVTFFSVAQQMPGKVIALVLTGMGSDGCLGARALRDSGSTVWAQDEQSCVVYGMPMAIVKAGLANQVLPLSDFGTRLQLEV